MPGFSFAKASLETKAVSTETLEALRGREQRACPLACATGTRASGDQCVPIVCGPGQQLSARGTCVAAPQPAPKPAPTAKAAPQPAEAATEKPGKAKGMYDAPQPGMSCTMFGVPNAGGWVAGPAPVRSTYWCK